MTALKNTWANGEDFNASDANNVADAVNGLNQSGAFASRPAAAFPGRLYICTDTDAVYRDTGSAWQRVAFGAGGTTQSEPPTSGWTTSTLGPTTVAADRDGRLFTAPSVAGVNWRIEYRTLSPATNYTVTAYLESSLYQGNDGYAVLVLRNSTSGAFVVFGHHTSSTGSELTAVKYSSPTVGIAAYSGQAVSVLPAGLPKWLRIRDDGTNRVMEYSYNGIDWTLHFSIGRTDFITPDQVGWGAHASGGQTNYARLRSLSVV